MNPTTKGDRSCGAVIADLIKAGVSICLPFGDGKRYDAVIDSNKQFYKVQCKTGTFKDGVITFKPRSIDGDGKSHDYRGQVEYFGVWCPENNKSYLIPISEVGVSQCSLRIHEPKNKTEARIRYADSYEISGHNSVVECLVANENAVSSNLTGRSKEDMFMASRTYTDKESGRNFKTLQVSKKITALGEPNHYILTDDEEIIAEGRKDYIKHRYTAAILDVHKSGEWRVNSSQCADNDWRLIEFA
jgi:hypothetical protein